MDAKNEAVFKLREFNRFYMPMLDLLGNHYLGSEYSATEARVLFEIYEKDGCNAAYIAKKLNIDKSYLSRVLKNHEKNGYLSRTASEADSRSFDLHLTEAGIAETQNFIQKSNQQIGEILASLSADDCTKLAAALDIITELLKTCKETCD